MSDKREDRQVWFEVENKKIKVLPKKKYLKYNLSYDFESEEKKESGPITISLRKKQQDLEVYFWNDKYSIGFEYQELIDILEILKDKDTLIAKMVATNV